MHMTATGQQPRMRICTTLCDIELNVLSTSDISVRNEVINLGYAQEHPHGILSAASFLVSGSSRDSLVCVLNFIYEIFERRMPKYNLWLFLGNSAWQPDTRIVRHRKLWGALKARGVEITDGCRVQEVVIDSDSRLKFFGAVCLSKLSVEPAVDALLDERCSYIIALPEDFDVQRILNVGWSGELSEDLSLFGYFIQAGGLVFKRVGEFDDSERGFVSIGSPTSVRNLLD
ncbi:hypothetical protein C4J87_2641 [Pseudomonas sp. R1-43-08]|uniref:hypothetical protein n=1 Tax=Pseudomonas sp. R1-43-08 TaxID=1173270 RepID=UPI000F6C3C47|nr:hypothetical protein [Pseudomonas sp. R1-43-08]AZF42799.1 hypothetical protein C4J87_2641 [Pseudomonas sp. R1-43-08]